jgi:hypothetical protein
VTKPLKGSAEEQSTAAFLDVREQLQRMRAAIHDSRFSYLMARCDGDVIFLADAELTDSPDYSPPGQVYDEATDALRGVFVTKKPTVEGPVTDGWGDWVSGLAPISILGHGNSIAPLRSAHAQLLHRDR